MESKIILEKIIAFISEILESRADDTSNVSVSESSILVGEGAIIDSHGLVELMLEIEEFAEDELDIDFDWQGDATLSAARSIFRTPTALTDHLKGLAGLKS